MKEIAEIESSIISSQLRWVVERYFSLAITAELKSKRLRSPVLEFWNNLWVLGTVPFSLSQSFQSFAGRTNGRRVEGEKLNQDDGE